jgi:carbonic anhydrase/acetyltransferase-like protein (isoleucine patch superfamily)
VFREYSQVHRGTQPDTFTVMGDGNYLMTHAHVAHNCRIGSRVIVAGGALVAGHVDVDDDAFISGNCVVHQHVRIGRLSIMRGLSRASRDVPPFALVDGTHVVRGVNRVGLRRAGFDRPRQRALVEAFRVLFHERRNLRLAMAEVEAAGVTPEVQELLASSAPRAAASHRGRPAARRTTRRTTRREFGLHAPEPSRRLGASSPPGAPVLNKRRFIVGAALIAAAVSYLVYAGIRTSSMYYFELEEFLAQRDAHAGESMRVKGWVRDGSIRWDARTNDLAFELARQDGSDPVPSRTTASCPTCSRPAARWSSRDATATARSRRGRSSRAARRSTSPSPMPEIGRLATCLALLFAVYAIGVSLAGGLRRRTDLVRSGEHAAYVVFGLVLIAAAILVRALLQHDFSLEYVAAYSSSTLPAHYAFAALWGGQKGSLLFWALLLSGFSTIVHLQNRQQNRELMPWVTATLMTVAGFFLALTVFVTDPFERMAVPATEGRDLNPLLQNYWMMIHPPSLYLGYVSASVPFAFAIARSWRAGSGTSGSGRRGAGRSSPGRSSRWAISSARGGRTRCSAGAATGRGTRSRTRPSCPGSSPRPISTR